MAAIITLHQGDITRDDAADVIVNAANSTLLGGGGVDGAIHRAAGPGILEECRQHAGCKTGDAKITGAGNLAARYIIHAVGPVWRGGTHGEAHQLASCYRRSVELAAAHDCRRVAFPAISTGAFAYPVVEAAEVALLATREALETNSILREARFWLYDESTHNVFQQQLNRLGVAFPNAGPDVRF
jgi:O-acetyl-ADP-ribose deacetylase